MQTLRVSSPRHADRERNVRAGYGCISSRYLGHIPSGTRMEWEDCSPTHSLWEQSSKRHRDEIWCTETGDVEKCRAYLGSAPIRLLVNNPALACLKTYLIDQSYIGR